MILVWTIDYGAEFSLYVSRCLVANDNAGGPYVAGVVKFVLERLHP